MAGLDYILTKVNKEDVTKMETPYHLFPDYAASHCFAEVGREKDGSTFVELTAGDTRVHKNENEPPTLIMDWGNAFSFRDSVLRNDKKAIYDSVKKICDEPFAVKHSTENRSRVSKAESNMEYCFFNDINIESLMVKEKAEKLVFISPTRGTIVRAEKSGLYPDMIVFPKRDTSFRQFSEVSDLCRGLGFVEPVREEYVYDNSHFCYMSFCASFVYKYKIKKFIGFEPNPTCLANSGCMTSCKEYASRYKISYDKGYDRRMVYMKKVHGIYIYPIDVLQNRYKNSSWYKPLMPLWHDMYSSFDLSSNPYNMRSLKIGRKRQFMLHALFLVGDYSHDKKGIKGKNGKYVYKISARANSFRSLDKWIMGESDKDLMRKACYMISPFSSIPVFLGKKRSLSRITKNEMLWMRDRNRQILGDVTTCSLQNVSPKSSKRVKRKKTCIIVDGLPYVDDVRGDLFETIGKTYRKASLVPCNFTMCDAMSMLEYDKTTYSDVYYTKFEVMFDEWDCDEDCFNLEGIEEEVG